MAEPARDVAVPTQGDLARRRLGSKPLRFIVVIGILVAVFGAIAWYVRERPAASLRETMGAIGRPDAMTVEAIAEGGSSVVGRNVSIVEARVSKVTGERTFWVVGSEGPGLLVVMAVVTDADDRRSRAVRVTPDQRVQLNGVVREGRRDDLSAADQAEVQRASVYLVAEEVIEVRR